MRKSDREKYDEAIWRQGASRREGERVRLLATETPNPGLITLALDSRGLDGPEVDEACGVAEPTVDRWEQGLIVPTGEEVTKLAALTRYPVEFFYQKVPPEIMFGWMCGSDGCELVSRA